MSTQVIKLKENLVVKNSQTYITKKLISYAQDIAKNQISSSNSNISIYRVKNQRWK